MSENVITMKKEKENTEKKLEGFVSKNRKGLLIGLCAVLVAAVVVCVSVAVCDSGVKKGLAAVDSIEYAYTKDSAEISAEEVATRQENALDSLKSYVTKSGVVGVRANLLAADIAFAKADYENALSYYTKAASASKKAYTAPVAYYNSAVCNEALGNSEKAYELYETAASCKDFYLATHAIFSQGRVAEKLENYENAAKAYNKLVDSYSDDEWTNLAQSRLVVLKAEGKIN